MSADYHAKACKMKQEWVEQAMLQYAIFRVDLSSSDAHCRYSQTISAQHQSLSRVHTEACAERVWLARLMSIHKFWQIISVDRDPSRCQQTIVEFVSITRISKQCSPISIVHRSPVNALGDRDDAIMGYSTILHSRHFWLRVHVMGSRSVWFHSAIWLVPQIFER